jgi:hypothetical protein
MPSKAGSANYKNNVLIKIMSELLPNGEYSWQAVALTYQEQSKEIILHDSTNLKKQWIKKIMQCNEEAGR